MCVVCIPLWAYWRSEAHFLELVLSAPFMWELGLNLGVKLEHRMHFPDEPSDWPCFCLCVFDFYICGTRDQARRLALSRQATLPLSSDSISTKQVFITKPLLNTDLVILLSMQSEPSPPSPFLKVPSLNTVERAGFQHARSHSFIPRVM